MSSENFVKARDDYSAGARKVAVFPAWPYANGPRHLGHGASLLPADTLARFHRAKGDDVLMVSGTDEYGTPNFIAAQKAGVPTDEYVTSVNKTIREDFEMLGMSFDWFTRTTSDEHREVAHELFEKLAENGYLEKGMMMGSFDSETGESLPDRYIEGGCPSCGKDARGDQCESCSALLDPIELINPRSSITDNTVEFKETEHWFLMLDKLAPKLHKWVSEHESLRPNAKNASLNQIKELRPRAITRDMQWGVPLPAGYELDGEGEKVLYVWFEAVTGYLSASVEWARDQGEPDKWKEWWDNPESKHIYAMGKDNVPFHTIILPAILLGASEAEGDPKLHTPDVVASTEYLTLGDGKFSSSRGNTLYIRDLVKTVGVDATRFYLLNNGPESRDKKFNLEELVTVNNDELLAKWGNLVQRVLTLTVRNFDNKVPEVLLGALPEEHHILVNEINNTYEETAELLFEAHFSKAVRRILDLCGVTNRFMNAQKPWSTAKTDRSATANTLYTALTSVDNLSRLFMPFMPDSSQKVHELLGYSDNPRGEIKEHTTESGITVLTGNYEDAKGGWEFTQIPSGQNIRVGDHLFKKLDVDALAQELQN